MGRGKYELSATASEYETDFLSSIFISRLSLSLKILAQQWILWYIVLYTYYYIHILYTYTYTYYIHITYIYIYKYCSNNNVINANCLTFDNQFLAIKKDSQGVLSRIWTAI